jgi:WD40 repeat protein
MAKKKTSNKAQAKTQAPATEKDVRVRVFEGHGDAVWRVAMPADGRFALTTSDDGTVRKWDLDSEQRADVDEGVVLAKSEDGAGFWGVAVTADGGLAAAGDTKGRMLLLDPQADLNSGSGTDPILATVQAHTPGKSLGSLAFCGDGEAPSQARAQRRARNQKRDLELHSVGRDNVLRRWHVRKLQQLLAEDADTEFDARACLASCPMPFSTEASELVSGK